MIFPKCAIKRLLAIVRFQVAGRLPETLVLLRIVSLALPDCWLSLCPRLRRHRTGASIVQAPYMAHPATRV